GLSSLYEFYKSGVQTTYDYLFGSAPAQPQAADPAQLALAKALHSGETNEMHLTNLAFYARHPQLVGKPLAKGSTLATEWVTIRNDLVRPAIAKHKAGGPGPQPHQTVPVT